MSEGKGNSQRGAKFRNVALSVTVGLLTYCTVEFFKFAPVAIKYLADIHAEQILIRKDFEAYKKTVSDDVATLKSEVSQNTATVTMITTNQSSLQTQINTTASAISDLSKAFSLRAQYRNP